MRSKYSAGRLKQLQHCLNSLGTVRCRALFEGYSLSINNLVFGMLVKGDFFLRACDDCKSWLARHRPPLLIINRKGRELHLDYYLIEDALWNDPGQLLYLCALSLKAVCQEKLLQKIDPPLKDLPNLSAATARHLLYAGVKNLAELQGYGAREVWMKLVRAGKSPGLDTLYAIEGAIQRRHMGVLSKTERDELRAWYEQYGSGYEALFSAGKHE